MCLIDNFKRNDFLIQPNSFKKLLLTKLNSSEF